MWMMPGQKVLEIGVAVVHVVDAAYVPGGCLPS
jgi:hypothetical protein